MNKIKHFISLKNKIMIYTLIPIIISFSFMSTVIFILMFNSIHKTAKTEFLQVGQKHVTSFENKLSNATGYLSIVASMMKLQAETNSTDRELLKKTISSIFDNFGLIDGSNIYFESDMYDGMDSKYINTEYGTSESGKINWYFYSNDGKTVFLSEGQETNSKLDMPYYNNAKELKKPIYSEPFIRTINGKDIHIFTLIHPLHTSDNKFIGAVTADIFLEDIYAELQNEKIYETGYIIISNDNGQVIYSPRFDDIGKSREEVGLAYELHSKTKEQVFFNAKSILNDSDTLITMFNIYNPLLDSYFYISIAAPLDEINLNGTPLIVILIIFAMIIIIGIALLIYYLIDKISAPIREITESANKIANGDYSTRIKGDYKGEFAVVKDSVNKMANSIEVYMVESENSLNILKNILNGLDAFIYVTIPKTGEILFINDRMKEHFDLKGDGIGQYCYKVLQDGIDKRCDFCPCYQLDEEPDKVVIWEECNTITKRNYRNTDCYIDWIGGVKAHLQHSVDITDIKKYMNDKLKAEREAIELRHKTEEAQETSRMKSIFLANMSHEIRTPMNGIIGFSELALDDNIAPKTRDYLTKIKASAESLLQIINDILDISKIESGKIGLENIPFDLSDVFQLCRTITSPKAMEKGVFLFCYAEPSLNKMLIGDPTRLRQVLLNLLSNAVKFTNNGMVKLLSAVTKTSDNSVTMHFEVKDNGIGMSLEQVKKIFLPFVQADDSTTRKYGGTGLGLTITKNIIELMGGELKVESTLGLGSKFSFDLTFGTVDVIPDYSGNKDTLNVLEKPSFKGEILVCEDNEMNRHVICDHLSRLGFDVSIAVDGKKGVELVKHRMETEKKPFDLILMDIHMPIMDGLEATEKILEMGSKTPIIALTANIMLSARETYHSLGMVDCLPKPFSAQELWSCLLKYLNPIHTTIIDEDEKINMDKIQHKDLIKRFVIDNQTTFNDISKAIQNGEIKLAHRLAHTLKSVAGLVGKTMLQEAARIIEDSLSKGISEFTTEQMDNLEFELNNALKELMPLVDNYKSKEQQSSILDPEKSLALLNKLKLLLEADSFDCLSLTDELNLIPGTKLLIEQIEDFNFEEAHKTLEDVIERIKVI